MAVLGIVSEYNPFHSGHGYQIAQAKKQLDEDAPVVAVMSGNWVQQADCAIADKWTRARLALMGGVDLVLELPTLWATASAESFARGGIGLLAATGVVDTLSFGSECGDIDRLRQVAACLDSPSYQAELRRFLDEGKPFAICRQAAVEELLGEEPAGLLSHPNNNLGIEYIRALHALNSSIVPTTVRRTGQGHNEVFPRFISDGQSDPGRLFWEKNPVLSATNIRRHLMDGAWELMTHYLPEGGWAVLAEEAIHPPALSRVERAMLVRVRTMAAGDWARLPDSGTAEGLPQRLERAGRQAASMAEFFDLAKTRRYTLARLQRLVLWAFLGLTAEDRPESPLYLRVLGFNERGQALLRQMKQKAALPILTRPIQARELDAAARRLFELESRCTDLYGLCFELPRPAGLEWTCGPVRGF